MSYILDALRRADAERGRGAVPGLHTQAAPADGASLGATGRVAASSPWAVAGAVAAVAVLAAGGTWWFMQRQAPVAGGSAKVEPVASAVSVASVAATGPVAVPASAPIAEPVAVAPRPAPVAPTLALESQEAGRKRQAAAPEPPRARAKPAVKESAPAPAKRPVAELTPAPEAPPASPVFAQGDLPESVRVQLPTLKVSGITYSSNPKYRMAIVNGQVLHEGEPAAPGLLLDRIEPGRTVWTFRGYRYAVASQ